MPEQSKKISFEQRLAALKLTKDDFYALVKMGATLNGLEEKRHPLCMAIYKKLKTQERIHNLQFFLGILNRLNDEKYRPSPNDEITNPLAIRDPENDYGGAIYSTVAEKRIAYNRALSDGAVAYVGFNQTIPLGALGAEFNDVEFIGGLWRVQKKFPYKITEVRDRQFVLVEKLPRTEKNQFEYYKAALATWGGTGCSTNTTNPDWIVAKYETPRGTFMSYGQSIEQARAFLAISIYDEYQNLIHGAAFEK